MLKKLLIILTALSLTLSLCACGKTCKVDNCDEPAYEKSEYCEYHRAMKMFIGDAW